MKRFLAFWGILALLCLLCCCSSTKTITKEVPVPVVTHDTVRITNARTDSVYVRDSIYVEGEKEYRDRLVYRNHTVHDTLYVARIDTIPKVITIREKTTTPAAWYETAAKWIGYLCCIAVLLWLLFLYLLKRK